MYMRKQKMHTARANEQVLRVRRIYSQIGEPLPVDVIIDLCLHLDQALELVDEYKNSLHGKKTACSKPN